MVSFRYVDSRRQWHRAYRSPEHDQSTLGPIARSADDLKLALNVVAGADQPESAAWRLSLPPARHDALKDFRVLVLDDHPQAVTADDIRNAPADLAGRLRREGCKVEQDRDLVPELNDLAQTFSALLMSLIGVDMPGDAYAAEVRRAADEKGGAQERGITMNHRDWTLLDRHRLALDVAWVKTFRDRDVVLFRAAPPHSLPARYRALS